MDHGATINLDELVELREKTDRVAQFFEERIERHVRSLQPLFVPARIFGRFASRSAPEVRGAERSLAELRETYRAACGAPFKVTEDLGEDPLRSIGSGLAFSRWEYSHSVSAEGDGRTLTVASPFRWIVTHDARLSLEDLRRSLPSTSGNAGDISAFLVGAITLAMLMDKYPDLGALLSDLGYSVGRSTHPDLGGLSLVTLDARVQSFRPADDVMVKAAKMAGVEEFTELLDLESADTTKGAVQLALDEALA